MDYGIDLTPHIGVKYERCTCQDILNLELVHSYKELQILRPYLSVAYFQSILTFIDLLIL